MNRFQAWFAVQPRALRALLVINVVFYVVWQLLLVWFPPVRAFVWLHLALNPALPNVLFEPWQLVTYNFLHLSGGLGGLLHIGFNMLWLYWIGKEYEELHGPHRLLSAYVLGGIGGGLLTVLLHAVAPGVAAFGGPVHGASASVLGVITTVAVMYPYKSVALIFIGTVRLIYLVVGYLLINLLFLSGGGMSVSAHFGGALSGYLLAKAESGGLDLSSWALIFFGSRRRPSGRPGKKGSDEGFLGRLDRLLSNKGGDKEPANPSRPANIRRMRTSKPEPHDQASDRDVDEILDKISARGYESLTEEEKRILYEASKR